MRLGKIKNEYLGAYQIKNLSKIVVEQVKKDILEVGNRRVILVTHVVTHPDFIVPMPHR